MIRSVIILVKGTKTLQIKRDKIISDYQFINET